MKWIDGESESNNELTWSNQPDRLTDQIKALETSRRLYPNKNQIKEKTQSRAQI